jgi:hypothetical protein
VASHIVRLGTGFQSAILEIHDMLTAYIGIGIILEQQLDDV